MALAIHKPGQGYWVRMLTAAIIALLSISLAMFLWNQAPAVVDRLPKQLWNAGLAPGVTANIPAGTAVNLLAAPTATAPAEIIGTGLLTATTSTTVSLDNVKLNQGKDGSQIATLSPVDGGTALPIVRPQGEPPVQPQLVGGALLASVLLLGAILGYWIAGIRVGTVEWLIACDFEMKRVHWSSLREIMSNTTIVIGACVVLTLIIYAADLSLSSFFRAIKLLG